MDKELPALPAQAHPKGAGRKTPAGPGTRGEPEPGDRRPDRRKSAHRGETVVTRVDSIDSMILPQVHLRKPCYDFSFL